jgi:AraC family transcriptional activator of mtrCDE
MAGEPLWRISRVDLDKLMGTMDVASVRLSECLFATGAGLHMERAALPTVHYGLKGSGVIVIEGEAAVELAPHTLVVAPANRSIDIIAAGSSCGRPRFGTETIRKNSVVPGSARRYEIGGSDPSFSLISGCFHAIYGPGLDLFASLSSPVVEPFDAYDQLDRLMSYAMVELSAREIGGGPMASALFKLVLLALLRRSLTSENAWVERFSFLKDPPIARAFAEMAACPAGELSVQALCRSAGLSRSAFMARFSAAFGEPPISVLRRLRMRHAAGLLAANALSIEQVAFQAGYQSRSSFTRTFRKHYGTDPSAYRAKAKRIAVAHDRSDDYLTSTPFQNAM